MTYRNPLVTYCLERGFALDREIYLAIAYPDGVPESWTAEHEEQLPEIFRKPRRWQILPNQKGRGAN